jgi:hypothetical protein
MFALLYERLLAALVSSQTRIAKQLPFERLHLPEIERYAVARLPYEFLLAK